MSQVILIIGSDWWIDITGYSSYRESKVKLANNYNQAWDGSGTIVYRFHQVSHSVYCCEHQLFLNSYGVALRISVSIEKSDLKVLNLVLSWVDYLYLLISFRKLGWQDLSPWTYCFDYDSGSWVHQIFGCLQLDSHFYLYLLDWLSYHQELTSAWQEGSNYDHFP